MVRRLQAEYLAEAGLGRARFRLAKDPAYAGEVWTIPASEFGKPALDDSKGGQDAVITISIETPKDHSKIRVARIQADYPRDPQLRARHSRQAEIEVEPQSKTTGGTGQ
jgi:hypothetical protein